MASNADKTAPKIGRGQVYSSILDTIGNTPLVKAERFALENGLNINLLLKLEFFSPMASVKDRIGRAMLEALEKSGKAVPGKTVLVEPTSGNTGIALSLAAAAKGYEIILTMPETMSIERRKLSQLLGAKIVLTDGSKGMKGAIAKAQEIVEATEGAVMPQQFENMANPQIHYQTTGPEIWNDTQGKLDYLIAGTGTGGTLSGAGKFLKEQDSIIKMIAVEPEDSPVLAGGTPGPHKIQGIGPGFIPDTLDTKIYDEVIEVSNDEALNTARAMARLEGIAGGISAGAAIAAATKLGKRSENKGKTMVVIVPDFAERYLSTALFDEEALNNELR